MEPARAPPDGQRLVGEVQREGRSDELLGRAGSPGVAARLKGNLKRQIPDYAWTDLTYLLHKHGISWRYYVFKGVEPDCADDSAIVCKAIPQDAKTPPGSGIRFPGSTR